MLRRFRSFCFLGVVSALAAPAYGAVHITSFHPVQHAPQPIGTAVHWTVKATNQASSPLTFQFNIAPPHGNFALVKDFDVGVRKAGVWKPSRKFTWTPTGIEGDYRIQVVIKDFTTGDTASKIVSYHVDPLVTAGNPVVAPTANPLVALFSAPSCPAGSNMRVSFQPQAGGASVNTYWLACHPPKSMTFEIAGMYPSTTYNMFAQTETGGSTVNGPAVTFTTSSLPTKIPFPAYTTLVAPGPTTDTADAVMLHTLSRSQKKIFYPATATDLSGNVVWYYYTYDAAENLLTRPLPDGTFLSIETGPSWNPTTSESQLLRQVDFAGNIVRETNTGIVQHQLLAMGVGDAQACNKVPRPPAVGAACLGEFHHDAIQTLPNGYTAVIADIEKIFPPGTQGDTSSLPVDIIGDIIIVLDANWQVTWYFETFEHAGGTPQLDINRPAVLGEKCRSQSTCPFSFLLGPGVAPGAHDWLHANALYYWPASGDLVWSCRNQDWILKVDYKDGTGTGNILWRLGKDGDFTFNNINNDPYPWFSHQHEAGIENGGAGPLTVFDNGNTRLAKPPIGLGSGCGPNDCNSRGISLTLDETAMQVTPLMSVDLGVYSIALGSAQLLNNGSYFFQPGEVIAPHGPFSYGIEILPTPGSITGTQVLNLQGPKAYRSWRMPDMYSPPTT